MPNKPASPISLKISGALCSSENALITLGASFSFANDSAAPLSILSSSDN